MNILVTLLVSGMVAVASFVGIQHKYDVPVNVAPEEVQKPVPVERIGTFRAFDPISREVKTYIVEDPQPDDVGLAVVKMNEGVFGAFNPAGGLTYRLQSSAGSTDTSLRLSSFTNRSDIALTMAILATDIGYGTISPQTSRSEFVSFTGITQNSNGSATLTGVSRGLSDISPFTASSTLRESHPGQSIFILSDSPQLFAEYAKRRSNEWITGTWGFGTAPTSSDQCDSSIEYCTKAYIDNTTAQGSATSTESLGGISQLATQLQMASSTDLGATIPLVVQAKYSTSTPDLSTGSSQNNYNVVSENDGMLNQGWLRLTEAFTWAGKHIFNNATTTTAVGSVFGVGTTTPAILDGLAVEDNVYVAESVGIGIATSTANTNLEVAGLTYTKNLHAVATSTNVIGHGWETRTNTGAGPTTGNNQATVAADCTNGRRIMGGGGSNSLSQDLWLAESYPSDSDTWTIVYEADAGGASANTMTVYAICVNP